MMPGDSKCKELAYVPTVKIDCGASTQRCVIDFLCRLREPALECIRVFSEIVKQARNVPDRGSAEFGRPLGSPFRDPLEMELQGLPVMPVLRRCRVGIVVHRHKSSPATKLSNCMHSGRFPHASVEQDVFGWSSVSSFGEKIDVRVSRSLKSCF